MSLLRAIIGGTFGSVVGAAIWLAVSNFAHAELGFMAVIVGVLAGYGAKRACSRFEVNLVHGLIAGLCALLSIAAAKYSWVSERVQVAKAELTQTEPAREELVSYLAVTLQKEITSKGQDHGSSEPTPAVLRVADEFWDELDEIDRQPLVNQALSLRATNLGYSPNLLSCDAKEVAKKEFINSFHLPDLLWMAIALGISLRLGSTEVVDEADFYDEDDSEDEEEYEPTGEQTR